MYSTPSYNILWRYLFILLFIYWHQPKTAYPFINSLVLLPHKRWREHLQAIFVCRFVDEYDNLAIIGYTVRFHCTEAVILRNVEQKLLMGHGLCSELWIILRYVFWKQLLVYSLRLGCAVIIDKRLQWTYHRPMSIAKRKSLPKEGYPCL